MVLIAMVAAALLMPPKTTLAQTPTPPTIHDFGFYSLYDLGMHESITVTSSSQYRQLAEFSMIPPIGQGPDRYYLLAMRGRMDMAPNTGSGYVFFGGSTDTAAALQIEGRIHRTRHGVVALWDSLDLIDGHQRWMVLSPSTEFFMRNFMRNPGMRVGVNTVEAAFVQYPQAKMDRLIVRPHLSGIEVTPLGTARLDLSGRLPPPPHRVGQPVALDVQVVSAGDRPLQHVGVGLDYDSEAIAGPTVPQPPALIATKWQTFIELVPLRSGTHALTISAWSSNGGSQILELSLPVIDNVIEPTSTPTATATATPGLTSPTTTATSTTPTAWPSVTVTPVGGGLFLPWVLNRPES